MFCTIKSESKHLNFPSELKFIALVPIIANWSFYRFRLGNAISAKFRHENGTDFLKIGLVPIKTAFFVISGCQKTPDFLIFRSQTFMPIKTRFQQNSDQKIELLDQCCCNPYRPMPSYSLATHAVIQIVLLVIVLTQPSVP